MAVQNFVIELIEELLNDNNSKVLLRGIYRQIGDMALVLYISLGSIGEGASRNIIFTMVLREMMQKRKNYRRISAIVDH